MTPIKHLPIDEQPREKLLQKGANTLTDSELLAILLRTGIKGKNVLDLARELIETFGSLRSLFNASAQEIQEIKGLDKAKTTTLIASIELARRAMKTYLNNKSIKSPKDVFEYVYTHMSCLDKEIFIALYLNSKNVVIHEEKLGSSSASSCLCQPYEFLRGLFKSGASRLIIVHNHPSNDLTPSALDIQFTNELNKHLKFFGFELLDHIIIAGEAYKSLKEAGHIN